MSLLNQLKQHKFKLLCFILLLLFAEIFYLNFKNRQRASKQNHAISDFANHLLSYTDSLERQNAILANVLSQNLQDDNLKEKVCNSIVDDGVDPSEISKGYDCLAKLELKKQDIASIYRAIRYQSLALEAFGNEKITADLIELSKSNNPDVAARALYRMSLINLVDGHDLKKAAALRAQVLEMVSFPQRKSIDVLFSLNDKAEYINYARTAMASILLNADLDSDYNFYVIMDSKGVISAENQAKLDSLHHLSSYKIKFMTLSDNIIDPKLANFSEAKIRILMQKLLVEDLLPDLDKIITLDVDLIVLRDLYRLQAQGDDFGDKVFAAEVENVDLNRKDLCGFSFMSANTGVNVQNLRLMREIKNSKHLVDEYQKIFASKHKGCLRLIDQDVLNLTYKDKIKFISKRWNYLPVFDYNTKFMSYIIHFGGTKPSEEVKTPENILYMKYSKFAQ